MKTFEGRMTLKRHKNDRGNTTPLTIDCDTKAELNRQLRLIAIRYYNESYHSVRFEMSERK